MTKDPPPLHMIQMSTQLSHVNWVNIVISQKNDHNFCGAFILTVSFLCFNILSSIREAFIYVLADFVR